MKIRTADTRPVDDTPAGSEAADSRPLSGVRRTRPGFIAAALAMVGLLVGLSGAYVFNARTGQYRAQTTLAMLPGPEVQVVETPAFWEVLNSGQATRTAAVVLGDGRRLGAAASAAGVPRSTLSLSAGAVPQTTLITVTVKATSAAAAKAVLESVLNDAIGLASKVAGPFELQTATAIATKSLNPQRSQVFGALGIAGLLIGAGAGLLIGRSARRPERARDIGDHRD